MRRFLGTLAMLAALTQTGGSAAEELTIALSTPEIEITSNFSGASVTLFGVIERVNGETIPEGGYDVVATMLGPGQSVVVRRKDRLLGVWANRASETLLSAPSLYALRTSSPMAEVADAEALADLRLGLDNIGFVYRGRVIVNDPSADEFRQAFLRLKTDDDLFSEAVDVSFIGDAVFRTTIDLPANIPVGRYTARVHLFANGELLANASETMRVSKSGVEQIMFSFAHDQSLIYGIVSVILALFTGWLGGVLFRRD